MVDMASAINDLSGAEFALDICNCDRSIGARISGEIARKHGNQGMAKRRSPSASKGLPVRASACGTPVA
jgi:glutamate synthase domain-containing protein 3